MAQERAVLAGGCFWRMQDLIRKLPGVVATRVGYTGGDVPHATYRNHGTHAEGIEILFDPARRTSSSPPATRKIKPAPTPSAARNTSDIGCDPARISSAYRPATPYGCDA